MMGDKQSDPGRRNLIRTIGVYFSNPFSQCVPESTDDEMSPEPEGTDMKPTPVSRTRKIIISSSKTVQRNNMPEVMVNKVDVAQDKKKTEPIDQHVSQIMQKEVDFAQENETTEPVNQHVLDVSSPNATRPDQDMTSKKRRSAVLDRQESRGHRKRQSIDNHGEPSAEEREIIETLHPRLLCLKVEYQFRLVGDNLLRPPQFPKVPQLNDTDLRIENVGILSNVTAPRAARGKKQGHNSGNEDIPKYPFVNLYLAPSKFIEGKVEKAALRDSTGNNCKDTCHLYEFGIERDDYAKTARNKFVDAVIAKYGQEYWAPLYKTHRSNVAAFKTEYIEKFLPAYQAYEVKLFRQAVADPTTQWILKRPRNGDQIPVKELCVSGILISQSMSNWLTMRDIEELEERAKEQLSG